MKLLRSLEETELDRFSLLSAPSRVNLTLFWLARDLRSSLRMEEDKDKDEDKEDKEDL